MTNYGFYKRKGGMMVKSISYSQTEIIEWIQQLYGDIECDCTYSKGVFYKDISKPKLKFDINPQDGVAYADCRHLPLQDQSINCMMYDPPFLATKGKSLQKEDDSNLMAKRFGVYPTEKELFEFYADSLSEFKRVIAPKGVLIIKCQNKVSSGKQILSHVWFINEAKSWGFCCEDIFILLAKSRLTPEWQVKNQKHARKFHSYFLVFRRLD